MTRPLPYERIPEPPPAPTGGAVVARMLDGLGFRFRWATEGLSESDFEFRPGADSMSIGELVRHVWGLVNWIGLSVFGGRRYERPDDPAAVREQVLKIVAALRDELGGLDEEGLLALRRGRRIRFLLRHRSGTSG